MVVFYRPGCNECDSLRDSFQEFAQKFASLGYVQAAALNCGKHGSICKKERQRSPPGATYYGPGEMVSKHNGGLSYKTLSQWAQRVMADFCIGLSREAEARSWLAANDTVPHVIFFSDRKSTPPLLKTLSLEFKGRAALGIVLAGAEASLTERFGVKRRPAMLHVLDEETFRSDSFDKEFTKEALTRFISRAVGKHRSSSGATLKELTPTRFGSGDCTPSDGKFCLILFSAPGKAGAEVREIFRGVAQQLGRDQQPIKVFFVQNAGFMRSFGSLKPGAVVLYRPKRGRFKLFDGDTSSIDTIAAFVDSAVGGGAPLPEKLKSLPSWKDEL